MTTPDRFDQLAASYNFRIPTDRVTLFTDVVQSRTARLAKECGFEEPRFAGPLRPFLHLMNWKRTKSRNPRVLLELYAVLRKRT